MEENGSLLEENGSLEEEKQSLVCLHHKMQAHMLESKKRSFRDIVIPHQSAQSLSSGSFKKVVSANVDGVQRALCIMYVLLLFVFFLLTKLTSHFDLSSCCTFRSGKSVKIMRILDQDRFGKCLKRINENNGGTEIFDTAYRVAVLFGKTELAEDSELKGATWDIFSDYCNEDRTLAFRLHRKEYACEEGRKGKCRAENPDIAYLFRNLCKEKSDEVFDLFQDLLSFDFKKRPSYKDLVFYIDFFDSLRDV